MVLFEALRLGPAYLVFPVISLYPVVTVILSAWILKEKASRRAWSGIVLALFAILMLSYQPRSGSVARGYLWFFLAALVFLMWGVQMYVMKYLNEKIRAESIFFYST